MGRPGALAVLREQYEDRLRRATGGESSLLAERAAKRARFESLMAERLALVSCATASRSATTCSLALEAELDLEAARHGLAELRRADALGD